MWPRYAEQLLGLWLAASPFVLGHATLPGRLWLYDLVGSVLVLGFSMLTRVLALGRLHLALLPIATGLVLHGWWRAWGGGGAVLPAHQNWIVVGLALAMLAAIPSRSSQPPASWRHFSERAE